MGVESLTEESRKRYRAENAWFPIGYAAQLDHAAESFGDKLALDDGVEHYTYSQVVDRTRAIAHGLRELGVGAGDVVAVQSPSRAWLPLMHLACNRIGAVYLPLSDSWRHTETEHLLRLSEAVVVCVPPDTEAFSHREMLDEIRHRLPRLRVVISLGGGDAPTLEELAASPTTLLGVPADPEQWSFCMVTSGTTALPKITKWTDVGLNSLLLAGFGPRIRLSPDDTALALAPANTGATGYVFPIMAPLLIGATSVIMPKWSPDDAVRLLGSSGATFATAIPTQMVQLLGLPGLNRDMVPKLTRFNNGGAPLAADAAAQIEDRLGCRVHSMYGATDGGVPVMTDVDDPDEVRLSTVGRLVPGMLIRILDPMGADQKPGEPGEIVYQGLQHTFGYLNEPDRDEEMFSDGWYHSGDVAVVDEVGYVRIVGRIKEMILRGGQNISPREIEDAIARHPGVAQVAVVGIPDPVMGERVCAFVVPHSVGEAPTLESIKEQMLGMRLAKWKLPERLEVIDRLPMSAGGKVVKSELKALIDTKDRWGK